MTSEAITRLLNGLPRQILFPGVTPVTRMYNLEKLAGAGPLYIKRDDLNGVGPGGNKVRPLEYLLGEALARKNDTIIASGQANSNLCSIAASACCKLGVKCILVHNSNRPEKPAGNALLNYLSGVEEHYIGEVIFIFHWSWRRLEVNIPLRICLCREATAVSLQELYLVQCF